EKVGKRLGKRWKNVGQTLGKGWENVGKTLGKRWEKVGKTTAATRKAGASGIEAAAFDVLSGFSG
ncbi:MAG: hypothetical protein IJ991_05935, partial [Thermoguttaceae bacterium]|nr:hypothetical protein [Thermoguttaceae bacterium]